MYTSKMTIREKKFLYSSITLTKSDVSLEASDPLRLFALSLGSRLNSIKLSSNIGNMQWTLSYIFCKASTVHPPRYLLIYMYMSGKDMLRSNTVMMAIFGIRIFNFRDFSYKLFKTNFDNFLATITRLSLSLSLFHIHFYLSYFSDAILIALDSLKTKRSFFSHAKIRHWPNFAA